MNNATASFTTINTALSRGAFDKIVMTQEDYNKAKGEPALQGLEITIAENVMEEAARLAKIGYRVQPVSKGGGSSGE